MIPSNFGVQNSSYATRQLRVGDLQGTIRRQAQGLIRYLKRNGHSDTHIRRTLILYQNVAISVIEGMPLLSDIYGRMLPYEIQRKIIIQKIRLEFLNLQLPAPSQCIRTTQYSNVIKLKRFSLSLSSGSNKSETHEDANKQLDNGEKECSSNDDANNASSDLENNTPSEVNELFDDDDEPIVVD